MRRWLIHGLVSASLLALGSAAAQPGKSAGKKGWHASLETARALARKTGKPLMVVFRCEP